MGLIGFVCIAQENCSSSKRFFLVAQSLQNIDGFSCERSLTRSAYRLTDLHFCLFYFHSLVLPRASVDKKPQSSRALLKHCARFEKQQRGGASRWIIGACLTVRGSCAASKSPQIQSLEMSCEHSAPPALQL